MPTGFLFLLPWNPCQRWERWLPISHSWLWCSNSTQPPTQAPARTRKVKENASQFKLYFSVAENLPHTASPGWRVSQPAEQGLVLELASEDLGNKVCARRNTTGPRQACRRQTQLRGSHGNCYFTGSLPPSHQSGHLINVTQHHILLHWAFLHSVPASSPKPASIVNFCSLGNYQKLWLKEKKTCKRASLLIPFQFLLFGTHTNHALKVIYNMPV